MIYEAVDFLAVILPTGIAIASVVVGIRIAQGKSHQRWWRLVLAAGVLTSFVTWISQHHANAEHQREIGEQKAALQKLQTRLTDIRLSAQFLASRDAVLSTIWSCLPAGSVDSQITTEPVGIDGSSRPERRCPAKLAKPHITVAIGLCKKSETCHAVHSPDFAAHFANGEEDCVTAIHDTETSRLRLALDCKTRTYAWPDPPAISLSELRTGSLRVLIDARASSEFPNGLLLKQADLESVDVIVNGIEIRLAAKDFQKSPLEDTFVYVHDFTPQDLKDID